MLDKKILIVDDDVSILNLLEVVFQKEGFHFIYKAMCGVDALESFYKEAPDLIVLDVMLPDLDGNTICKKIRESSMTPILFLSAKSEENDKLTSYISGGDNYITKPFSTKEVVACVTAMLHRAIHYAKTKNTKDSLLFGECKLDFKKKECYRKDELISLTSKEYHLLEYLVENQNQTLSKEQLIEKIWGSYFDGYDNTVMVHISRLRNKIERDPSKPSHIITVKGRGYRFQTDGTEIL